MFVTHKDKSMFEQLNTYMSQFVFKDFRLWVTRKWYEHKREVLAWEKRVVDYSDKEWFAKNKWYLKKLYKGK